MDLIINNTTCEDIVFRTGGESYPLDRLIFGSDVVWERQEDYSTQYFTIENQVNENTITCTRVYDNNKNITYYISKDGTTWESHTGTARFTLINGERIMFKANTNESWSDYRFTSTGNFKVYGNIMSLIYGDNFVGQTALLANSQFSSLFQNSTYLTDAGNLILPATTLQTSCYNSMFYGCTSLTTAPALRATTLATYCYRYMFYECTSLTTAPNLPATTLATYCCSNMFSGCTSLTNAPELPATTLATYCYNYMFYGCTSLTTAPELPAATLAQSCYGYMFYGCTRLNYIKCLATNISAANCIDNWTKNVAATGTFVKKSSMNSWRTGTSGIPSGWTVQNA